MPNRFYADKIVELKGRAAILRRMILDSRASSAFLLLPERWLSDAERVAVGAEFVVPMIEEAITHAEAAVAMYGSEVRIIGIGGKAVGR